VGDGNILKSDVELGSTKSKVVSNSLRDSLSLGDELCGIELGDDSLQDFVSNRGEDSLIVIGTEVLSESVI
jgi:hypothetical protein